MWPRVISTKMRRWRRSSQSGPSPSSARASSTSSGSTLASPFPPFLEQTDAATGARMLAALIVIQFQAESRPRGRRETAVAPIDAGRVIDQVVHPRVGKIVEVFQHL